MESRCSAAAPEAANGIVSVVDAAAGLAGVAPMPLVQAAAPIATLDAAPQAEEDRCLWCEAGAASCPSAYQTRPLLTWRALGPSHERSNCCCGYLHESLSTHRTALETPSIPPASPCVRRAI
jgi:hypothetical protein